MNPFLPHAQQVDLVLASRSPRRVEIMRGLGFAFDVDPAPEHLGIDRMVHADVEYVQPLQPRCFPRGRKELPRMIGEDVAGEERSLDAPALRVGETRRGIRRQRDQLSPEAAAHRRIGDSCAVRCLELMRYQKCGHVTIRGGAPVDSFGGALWSF